jgi:hypothetical protein
MSSSESKPKKVKKFPKSSDSDYAENDNNNSDAELAAAAKKSKKKKKDKEKPTSIEEQTDEEPREDVEEHEEPAAKPAKSKKKAKKPTKLSEEGEDNLNADENAAESRRKPRGSRMESKESPDEVITPPSVLLKSTINDSHTNSGLLKRTANTAAKKAAYNVAMNQNTENRLLLTNLVESEQYGGAIKSIFDRNWFSKYNLITQSNIQLKQEEINNICRNNYNEFIGTVDSLLTMKLDINDFRQSIVSLNQSVQKSGQNLVQVATELSTHRLTLLNINRAKLAIKNCQSLIQLADKIDRQISAGKYFSALKSIEQLKIVHYTNANAINKSSSNTNGPNSFEFSEKLLLEIPKLIIKIKTAVKLEFIQWSNSIQRKSIELGQISLKHSAKQHNNTQKQAEKHKARQKAHKSAQNSDDEGQFSDNSGSESSNNGHSDVENGNSDYTAEEDDESLLDRCGVNFAPVFQCFHIFQQLSIAEQFVQLYKDKRRQQAIMAVELKPKEMSKDSKETKDIKETKENKDNKAGNQGNSEFLANYSQFFSGICGFFIIEAAILRSGNGLLLQSEVESLWQVACSKLTIVLGEELARIAAVEDYLEVKSAASLMASTLHNYNYDVSPLLNYLFTHRNHFEALLYSRLAADLREILKIEKFEPMAITDEKQYEEFVLAYNLEQNYHKNIHITFPTTMPFSLCVPLFIRVILMFIQDYYNFCQFLVNEQNQLYSTLIRAVDRALINEINSALNTIIDTTPQLHISQAVQFSINAQTMADSCNFIQSYIHTYIEEDFSQLSGGNNQNDSKELISPQNLQSPQSSGQQIPENNAGSTLNSSFTLSAATIFQQTRIRCEDLLFELIDNKIDEFMSLCAGLDWTPNEANRGANDYINDLIAYLSTTLVCLQYLPDAVRSAVHFTSCKHISANLLTNLANNVKKFNILAMINLDFDLSALENFANSCNIANLVETFSELRQLVDLFLSGDIEAILQPSIKQGQYPHLSTGKLLRILEKYKDLGLFAKVTNDNLKKIKRKNVENVIKKLKQ